MNAALLNQINGGARLKKVPANLINDNSAPQTGGGGVVG